MQIRELEINELLLSEILLHTSEIELQKSLNDLQVSEIELEISEIELEISFNRNIMLRQFGHGGGGGQSCLGECFIIIS